MFSPTIGPFLVFIDDNTAPSLVWLCWETITGPRLNEGVSINITGDDVIASADMQGFFLRVFESRSSPTAGFSDRDRKRLII